MYETKELKREFKMQIAYTYGLLNEVDQVYQILQDKTFTKEKSRVP